MTERHAFLLSIKDNPADDTPRLVYADWLEEHGETERAELVRVQIELAKPRPRGLKPSQPNLIGTETREFHKWGITNGAQNRIKEGILSYFIHNASPSIAFHAYRPAAIKN